MARDDMTQRQRQLYEQLAQAHGVEHRTYKEIAREMRVAERTLRRWAATPEYQQVLAEMRQAWREGAKIEVESIGMRAVKTLVELMGPTTRSEYVRFEAAKTLGEWAGLNEKNDEKPDDDREALMELYKLMSRPTTVNLTVTQPALALPAGDVVEGEVSLAR